MKRVEDLLQGLDLPAATGGDAAAGPPPEILHDLGADLPAGHLHLWGGPRGAGKTAFLLSLLQGAARTGRRVLYATYHLPAEMLAVRLLGMVSSIDPQRLLAGDLTPEQAHVAAEARTVLSDQSFWILGARGLSARSLEDRLVRMPFRADVLGVDFLQAVIRPDGQDLGGLVRDLSAMASRLHLAVVGALESSEEPRQMGQLADRAGWIAPAGAPGDRRAAVIENRYGARPTMPLHLDEATGVFRRVTTN